MKTGLQLIVAFLGILVSLPIWFYLLYQVLVRVQASELMWFLFWIYVPVLVITSLIARLAKDAK